MNTIFTGSENNNPSSLYRLKESVLDNGQMNLQEEREFNTYRWWVPYYAPLENVIEGSQGDDVKEEVVSAVHTKALFSTVNGVPVYDTYRVDANMPLLDNPESRKRQRKNMACTIKDLVEASRNGEMGAQTYSYADFAFCKHLGKVSNNYLITLRRFPNVCGDTIDLRHSMGSCGEMQKKIQNHPPDIGRMITWLGTPGNEMSNILKYSYKMKWTEQTGEIDDIQHKGGEGQGPLAGVFNQMNANYRRDVMKGRAGSNFSAKNWMNALLGGSEDNFNPPYPREEFSMMRDKNKAYGPVDCINKVTRRDIGLEFEHKFTLTFDYELRSYYGVNGKAAMMDLLANILACTYAHGSFWGGAHRFHGASQDNTYANLPIWKIAEQGRLTSPGDLLDGVIDSISMATKNFLGGLKGETTGEKIKNLVNDLGGMLLGGLLNKMGRPQKQAIAALLRDQNTGCWHLTVGNPKSPIIEVGNLICEGVDVEHYGPLGLDDFPTGIRVKVTLSHGKPRDIVGIEKMYGRGDTRIYTPLGSDVLNQYKNSIKIGDNSSDTESSSKYKNGTAKDEYEDRDIRDSVYYNKGKNYIKDKYASAKNKMSKAFDFGSINYHFGIPKESQIITASEEALYGSSDPPKSKK